MCVNEQSYGNPTDLMGIDVPHATNALYGIPIVVTTSILLRRLGIIVRTASGLVRLALYSDNGMAGSNSAPANFLAGALDYSLQVGRNEFAINSPPPTIPVMLGPGTYWLMAAFQASTSVAHGSGTQLAKFRGLTPWNAAVPSPFGTALPDDTATPPNYYLVGLPQ